MAAQVVADAGIFLATVLEETLSENAEQLLQQWNQQQVQIAAPVLLQYEIIAVLRKYVYRQILTTDEASAKCDILLALVRTIHWEVDEALLRRAYALAEQFNRPTAYDSQYLALAERLSCDFWTADERLFNAVNSELHWVRWLGNLGKDNQQV